MLKCAPLAVARWHAPPARCSAPAGRTLTQKTTLGLHCTGANAAYEYDIRDATAEADAGDRHHDGIDCASDARGCSSNEGSAERAQRGPGAPHWHFRLSHSFLHTNLKSPCVAESLKARRTSLGPTSGTARLQTTAVMHRPPMCGHPFSARPSMRGRSKS